MTEQDELTKLRELNKALTENLEDARKALRTIHDLITRYPSNHINWFSVRDMVAEQLEGVETEKPAA